VAEKILIAMNGTKPVHVEPTSVEVILERTTDEEMRKQIGVD